MTSGRGDGHLKAAYSYLRYLDNHLFGEDSKASLVQRSWLFLNDPNRDTNPTAYTVLDPESGQPLGLGFAHYWFYKLVFVLWHQMYEYAPSESQLPGWGYFRFTAKNSVEHISPQNPKAEDTNIVSEEQLNHFGNLALVSRQMNSEFSNKPFNEKQQSFRNKRGHDKRPDSTKMDLIYESEGWDDSLASKHHKQMFKAMREYYQSDSFG